MAMTAVAEQNWSAIVASLAQKRQAVADRADVLRKEKREGTVSLQSAMGDPKASKRLREINSELGKLAFEFDDLEQALAAAKAEESKATLLSDEVKEARRRRQISDAMQQYADCAAQIDDGFRLLVAKFESAHATLARAESLMNPEERSRLRQLHSNFGLSLAAGHHGVGAYLELGPRGGVLHSRRSDFATFVAAFTGPWLSLASTRKEK